MVDVTHDLKRAGLKATLPRIKVLHMFNNADGAHMTAEDVYKRLLAQGEEIGLATIYRVLTQFEGANLLMRHHFEGGKAVFELNSGKHHDHLVCVECGHVEEFFDPEIEQRQHEVAARKGFEVHDHCLYLYVKCNRPDCPNREKEM
ncbi:MAG: ferric iron uptake transcriptional regulator [Magnetococcales bacterium]|nr:ferric iron uptake transcriptional regulator [Magnetococcales bacterium]